MRAVEACPWALACYFTMACGASSLQVASVAQIPIGEPIPVSSMPPPALSEQVSSQPNDNTVWADGCWEPSANSWVWLRGGWVIAPATAALFRGQLNVGENGALWWQPCTWIEAGKAIGWIDPLVPAVFPLNDRTIYEPPT